MYRLLLIAFITIPSLAISQNLSGTWVGTGGDSYLKLVVIHRGDSLFGYTYDSGPGYCKATFAGVFMSPTKSVKGRGLKMLQNSGTHTLASYKMNYSKRDDEEYLSGQVFPVGALLKILTLGLPSPLYLKKTSDIPDTISYMRQRLASTMKVEVAEVKAQVSTDTLVKSQVTLDTIKVTPVQPVVVDPVKSEKIKRSTNVVETIITETDTIKIFVYDNGVVDNDTVTVFFDNQIVLNKSQITATAKEVNLIIPKDGKQHSIDLFANNLGLIPPNTALIIIQAGKKRYELRASYDLQTNARILIQVRE